MYMYMVGNPLDVSVRHQKQLIDRILKTVVADEHRGTFCTSIRRGGERG